MDNMGKADTHVHTKYSGIAELKTLKFPESVTSPEEQVDCARKNKMDILCITDHDEITGSFIAEKYSKQFDDIEVIIGEEITTNDGEIIGLFLNEKIKPFQSVEETIDCIREQGGLTIAPHPFSFHVCGLKEKIFEIDLDGFEVLNGGHPDSYSNKLAQLISDKYPNKWAPMSSSDGHSDCTVGYAWTEFEGRTADDFRKAVLNKSTIPKGRTTPVLDVVKWSLEVVLWGQKMMYESLKGNLVHAENTLINDINKLSDLKKATAIVGGMIYLFPPVSFIATLASTRYLRIGARKMNKEITERINEIDEIISKNSM